MLQRMSEHESKGKGRGASKRAERPGPEMASGGPGRGGYKLRRGESRDRARATDGRRTGDGLATGNEIRTP